MHFVKSFLHDFVHNACINRSPSPRVEQHQTAIVSLSILKEYAMTHTNRNLYKRYGMEDRRRKQRIRGKQEKELEKIWKENP